MSRLPVALPLTDTREVTIQEAASILNLTEIRIWRIVRKYKVKQQGTRFPRFAKTFLIADIVRALRAVCLVREKQPIDPENPDCLVSINEAIKLNVPLKHQTVSHWVKQGYIAVAEKAQRDHRGGRVHFYRLGDLRRMAALNFNPAKEITVPAGFIRTYEAASILGYCEQQIRLMAHDGRLKSKSLRICKGRQIWFVEKADVYRHLTERGQNKKLPEPEPPTYKMILSPDHRECLHFRRSLWEQNSRKWSKRFYRIGLDKRKWVG